MLYRFENLANTLTQLGYPEVGETGFRIIRRDLTAEEQAGNIDFRQDGIYLTIDGQEHKGYMYLKFPDIEKWGFPKFHITTCQTILEQRERGQFNGRYFWHNSNAVSLEDRSTNQLHENIVLELCGRCSRQVGTGYSDTEEFFGLLDQQEQDDINEEYEVDIFGYTLDWPQISKAYRKEKDYSCEKCGIKMDLPIDRRFIHVHHKNGNKLVNRRSNLECLCILCHSYSDEHHEHNFERNRMQKEVRAFVNKYREKLIQIGNIYVNRV